MKEENFKKTPDEFHCDIPTLMNRLNTIDPQSYIKNRNYLDGNVTRLSPFITHGILSTRQLAATAIAMDRSEEASKRQEKFIFQLAWRDFFHRTWEAREEEIFESLSASQMDYGYIRGQLPKSILDASTGIKVIDNALNDLYATGYIHNHARMWLAFLIANFAHTDWRIGAKWMHYHLLDGDLASNTLSWQWVAGTFSKKQYIANQDNLNKYASKNHVQSGTFLDMSYEDLAELTSPSELIDRGVFDIDDELFKTLDNTINVSTDTLFVRSIYHLDPEWHAGEEGQHVIVIEPKWLKQFPMSQKRFSFIMHWVEQIQSMNDQSVQIVYAYYNDLARNFSSDTRVIFQAHNACKHWRTTNAKVEGYPWLFPELEGDYPSFFNYWNKAKKQLNQAQWLRLISQHNPGPEFPSSERDHAA